MCDTIDNSPTSVSARTWEKGRLGAKILLCRGLRVPHLAEPAGQTEALLGPNPSMLKGCEYTDLRDRSIHKRQRGQNSPRCLLRCPDASTPPAPLHGS